MFSAVGYCAYGTHDNITILPDALRQLSLASLTQYVCSASNMFGLHVCLYLWCANVSFGAVTIRMACAWLSAVLRLANKGI